MIIGEPIMLGGGGESASIFVTGLTENDTVTATKDGKTWNGVWTSKVIQGVITYGHLISNLNSYGTYTVTATNGTKTATENVLVDMATEYDIEMQYVLYLYKDGDECEDVTGGWTNVDYSWVAIGWRTNLLVTKNTDSLVWYVFTDGSKQMCDGISNPINVTNYSSINIDVEATTSSNVSFLLSTSKDYIGSGVLIGNSSSYNGRQTLTLDISSLTGNYYISGGTGENRAIVKVYNVWLE